MFNITPKMYSEYISIPWDFDGEHVLHCRLVARALERYS